MKLRLVDDEPLRLTPLYLKARAEAVDYLRHVARLIEEGELEADAVLVVTSAGDVHNVNWWGYHAWAIMSAAASSASDAYWAARWGNEYDPVAKANMREVNRRYNAAELEKKRAAKPFACACGQRYATYKGRELHAALARRRPKRWGTTEHHPVINEAPRTLRSVNEAPK